MSVPAAAPEFVEPRSPLEQALERVWAEMLGLERVSVRDSFFELGGHSLLAAELFARLEALYGVRLPLASLFPDATIERQAEVLEQGASAQPSSGSTIVPIHPLGHRPPFICVHAIDGDVLRFELLARLLGSEQPFYGIRARGLDADSEPIDDLEAMAAGYVQDLLRAGFVEPFYLGGFSSGAMVAFEMARQLGERGHAIALVALFDGQAPALNGSACPVERRGTWVERAWRSVEHLPADLHAYVADALRPGHRKEFLHTKVRGLPKWLSRQFANHPVDWEALDAVAGLSERHLAVAQAQCRAVSAYAPRVYSGRVTLFRARVRLLVSSHDRHLGWDALARGGVEVHAVGGQHSEILREPDVRELAAALQRSIDAAQAAPVATTVALTVPYVKFEEADVEQSVAARFERQVELYPDRLAIRSETHELTYAELNRFANRIAHAILQRSPSKGDQIGLLFKQQAPMIAASFGALKAGRVYVALDPTYPRVRQDFILNDAEVGIILTDSGMLEQAEALADGRTVVDVGAPDANGSDCNPSLPISPDACTYIVYTSGSTGKPKGVVENQRNVLHFTLNNTNSWYFCPNDRISLLVPYWFSASATPTFGALLNGAALLPMNVRERGLAGLADWLEQEKISIFHTSTSLFRHFARALPEGRVIRSVRMVYQGSEALYRSDVELYRQHFADHCVMANNLGASEMKNFSSMTIDKHTLVEDRVVPVGYPVPGVELLLLDEHDQPVEPGTVGEIVVRTRYLAPGYWRRPDLTARAFRPDPTIAEGRLYYTGDLGRIDQAGRLHHVGRRDFQVKIRGYRVELGDVTAALLELPELAEATVVAQYADGEGSRLIAYVVPASEVAPTQQALRAALDARLPSYMVPSVFISLASLPRNANGKLDTAALPPPGQARPEVAAG